MGKGPWYLLRVCVFHILGLELWVVNVGGGGGGDDGLLLWGVVGT